ncbi:MAG: flavodoxin-dependent (E)-4-hydroxy-3-methylbut-2-enyl-diphosphate synthase [Clostridiales bacterium]|nr:flavodoxin-dependent (E)-4-hydroxy-3-methylbut-2-enyl-diphosphate synthase [Clostridiales bacterium]
MYTRRKSKEVKIGNTVIGGSNSIAVQSMLNTPAHDADACVEQALRLEKAGCEIIRTAVPDTDCVKTVYKLKENLKIPVVADIHFDYKIALECAEAGADKIRINPGNIGSDDRVKLVADKCRQKNIPIRIGVNSGSLEKDILKKYGSPTAEALAESAMYHAGLLEKFDFDNIVISLKSSDVFRSYEAYSIISEKCNYPLHIGITEAGTERMGIIKSSAGLGALLISGIGDTIRISLTADPEKEVDAAYDLLKALNLRKRGIKFISCPTCGRTKIDLIKIASQAEERLKNCDKDITVAVMGCIVNGPGEAKEADIGIAGGDGNGLIFKKGEILRKVPEDRLIDELVYEIENTNFDE